VTRLRRGIGWLLASLAAAGGLVAFFASEFQDLHDVLTSDDRYDIVVRRQAAVPVLGQLAGDPTGVVTGITWHSWGDSTAIGTGISDYVGPHQTVAGGTREPVTIVAFDLGTCDGKLMYQAVEWYFPQHHQALNPRLYEDVCNGSYVGI
jgi:hypothetical protein